MHGFWMLLDFFSTQRNSVESVWRWLAIAWSMPTRDRHSRQERQRWQGWLVAFLISVEVERHPTPTLEEMVWPCIHGMCSSLSFLWKLKKTVQQFFNYIQSWQNLKHVAILALSPLSGGYLSTVAPRSTEPPSPVRETQSDAAKMFPSLSRILRPSIYTST